MIASRSESIAALAAALSKAQGAMSAAVKDSANPFFRSRYADLASVWDACRQPLSANELAIVQIVDDDINGKVAVETMLMHSSGEWISGRIAMKPVKDDPQGIGSVITYCRRYGLQAIAGIAPEDDDGNAASGRSKVPVIEHDIEIPVPSKAPVKAAKEPSKPPLVDMRRELPPSDGPSRNKDGSEIEYITDEQATWLRLKFEELLPQKRKIYADDFRRDFLKGQGYVDEKGQGTSKKIPKELFKAVAKDALKHAETIAAMDKSA